MPIKIDKKLPAVDILRSENIFCHRWRVCRTPRYSFFEYLGFRRNITKDSDGNIVVAAFSKYALQLRIGFLFMSSHVFKTMHADYLETFYKIFGEMKDYYFAGLIIAGAQSNSYFLKQ